MIIRLLMKLLRRLERRQWRIASKDAMLRRHYANGAAFDLERGRYVH
jgi:hypothetical protein